MNTTTQLHILFEDASIIVCKKPAGVATQSKNFRSHDMESLIKRHLYQTNAVKKEPYLAVIHRLDQPVSGILVFAKTPAAAKALSIQLQTSNFGKYYKALLSAQPPLDLAEQPLVHYMKKDGNSNTSSICAKSDPSGKKAVLQYKMIPNPTRTDLSLFSHCNLSDSSSFTLVQIALDTGRHHQIRIQMSALGCPILGDTKYGIADSTSAYIALCAYKLEFKHPITMKKMSFTL